MAWDGWFCALKFGGDVRLGNSPRSGQMLLCYKAAGVLFCPAGERWSVCFLAGGWGQTGCLVSDTELIRGLKWFGLHKHCAALDLCDSLTFAFPRSLFDLSDGRALACSLLALPGKTCEHQRTACVFISLPYVGLFSSSVCFYVAGIQRADRPRKHWQHGPTTRRYMLLFNVLSGFLGGSLFERWSTTHTKWPRRQRLMWN